MRITLRKQKSKSLHARQLACIMFAGNGLLLWAHSREKQKVHSIKTPLLPKETRKKCGKGIITSRAQMLFLTFTRAS